VVGGGGWKKVGGPGVTPAAQLNWIDDGKADYDPAILLLLEELCKGGCFRGDLECGFGNRDLENAMASPVLEVKG